MNKIMTWLTKAYRSVVDHLTKAIGIVGTAVMTTFAWVDPEAIHMATQTYLGKHATEKIGAILFALVIVRGWYTGRKAQSLKPPL